MPVTITRAIAQSFHLILAGYDSTGVECYASAKKGSAIASFEIGERKNCDRVASVF
ncbi:hypothetical protein [Coleofasciculus sp. H7-2]|uniref:hypothetical protein n=1 Tax=Coleofasciculus sp. H7-2 TaxID=3351545 RepID=UPI003671F339